MTFVLLVQILLRGEQARGCCFMHEECSLLHWLNFVIIVWSGGTTFTSAIIIWYSGGSRYVQREGRQSEDGPFLARIRGPSPTSVTAFGKMIGRSLYYNPLSFSFGIISILVFLRHLLHPRCEQAAVGDSSILRLGVILTKIHSWYRHTTISYPTEAPFCFLCLIFVDCQHLEPGQSYFVILFRPCEINFISLVHLYTMQKHKIVMHSQLHLKGCSSANR